MKNWDIGNEEVHGEIGRMLNPQLSINRQWLKLK